MEENSLRKPLIKWGWLRAIIGFILIFAVIVPVDLLHESICGLFGWGVDELASYAMVIPASIGVFLLLRRFLDRKPSVAFDLSLVNRKWDIIFGIGIGCSIMTLMFLGQLISGHLTISAFQFNISAFSYYFFLVLFKAAMEEIVLRGYVLENLTHSFNGYVAVIVSSVVFGLLHMGNNAASIVGVANNVLLGCLVGIYYIHRGNLWMPIALHFAWNFVMGIVYGAPISGLLYDYTLIKTQVTGSEFVTGGSFGYEGSLYLVALALVAMAFVQLKYKGKQDRYSRGDSPGSIKNNS